MLYLFTGSDSGKVRLKAFAFVGAARAKRPDAPYFRLGADILTEASLMDATAAQGLFYKKSLVLLDDPFSLKGAGALVLQHVKLLAESENLVVLVAPKLSPSALKKLEGMAEKTVRSEAKTVAPRGFNSALVNALAQKNGPVLWSEILKALRAGDAPEQVHALLHWKARAMLLQGSGKWGKQGARKLSRELIELLSGSRSGDLPLAENLERFALSL